MRESKQQIVSFVSEVATTEERRDFTGALSHSSKPAVRGRDANGRIVLDAFYLNGQLHRVDRPAVIRWYFYPGTTEEKAVELGFFEEGVKREQVVLTADTPFYDEDFLGGWKYCTKCGAFKPFSCFQKRNKDRTKRQSHCRECTHLNYTRYRKNNPTRYLKERWTKMVQSDAGEETAFGTGVTLYPDWKDYKTFEKWALDNGWTPEQVIYRINKTLGHTPGNCRVGTGDEAARSKSSTKLSSLAAVEIRRMYRNDTQSSGKRWTMKALADYFGVGETTVFNVIHRVHWKEPYKMDEPAVRYIVRDEMEKARMEKDLKQALDILKGVVNE